MKKSHFLEGKGLLIFCRGVPEFNRDPANLATVLLLDGVL